MEHVRWQPNLIKKKGGGGETSPVFPPTEHFLSDIYKYNNKTISLRQMTIDRYHVLGCTVHLFSLWSFIKVSPLTARDINTKDRISSLKENSVECLFTSCLLTNLHFHRKTGGGFCMYSNQLVAQKSIKFLMMFWLEAVIVFRDSQRSPSDAVLCVHVCVYVCVYVYLCVCVCRYVWWDGTVPAQLSLRSPVTGAPHRGSWQLWRTPPPRDLWEMTAPAK